MLHAFVWFARASLFSNLTWYLEKFWKLMKNVFVLLLSNPLQSIFFKFFWQLKRLVIFLHNQKLVLFLILFFCKQTYCDFYHQSIFGDLFLVFVVCCFIIMILYTLNFIFYSFFGFALNDICVLLSLRGASFRGLFAMCKILNIKRVMATPYFFFAILKTFFIVQITISIKEKLFHHHIPLNILLLFLFLNEQPFHF